MAQAAIFVLINIATIYLLFHPYLTYVITTPLFTSMFLINYKVIKK